MFRFLGVLVYRAHVGECSYSRETSAKKVFRAKCHNAPYFQMAQKNGGRTQTWQNVIKTKEYAMFAELFFQRFCKFEDYQNKTLGKTSSSDASGHSIEIMRLC